MDIEFRDEFKRVDGTLHSIDEKFKKIDERFNEIDRRFEKIDERFEQIDLRFEKVDSQFKEIRFEMNMRFDKMWDFQKWQAGLMVGLFAGIYIKLFFS
jgi:archaellum component FlaC